MLRSLKPYSSHSALPEGASIKRMCEKGFMVSKVLVATTLFFGDLSRWMLGRRGVTIATSVFLPKACKETPSAPVSTGPIILAEMAHGSSWVGQVGFNQG